MRIILIGQAAFAEKTLEKLLSKGEEVVAVYCPPDVPGGKLDPVKQKALQLGIPVRQHQSTAAHSRLVSVTAATARRSSARGVPDVSDRIATASR